MMRILRRMTAVAALAALLVLATVGVASATEPSTATTTDLDELKARVIAQIDLRIERFTERLEALEGGDGPRAEQLTALFTDGIADLEQLKIDVAAATSAGEVQDLVRRAYAEFGAHARVRSLYAHVQIDLDRFTHRLGLLEQWIDRAAAAGLDTTRASAQADAAQAGLDTAGTTLAGVDPGALGDGTLAQIREAHRAAHGAQGHIRLGFRALAVEAI